MNAGVLQEFVVGILFRIILSINWAYTMPAVLVIATTSAFKVDRHGGGRVGLTGLRPVFKVEPALEGRLG